MQRSQRFALITSTAIAMLAACGSTSDDGTLGESTQALTACASNALPRSNATASSVKGTNAAALAIDGLGNVTGGTRWESAYSDPQWIQIDLGSTVMVNRVVINWAKSASAKTYEIRLSNDAAQSTYTTLYSTGSMAATQNRTDDWSTSNGLKAATGRYLRIQGLTRNSTYGYSIWELYAYGDANPSCGATGDGGVGGAGGAAGAPGAGGSGATAGAGGSGAGGGASCSNALSMTASASSVNSTNTAAKAVDNNTSTRWESVQKVDPQWLQIDLGAPKLLSTATINWQNANAKTYDLQVSDDAASWRTLVSKTNMPTGARIDTIDLTGLLATGRYVRMYGTVRNTVYGYSIYEMAVRGADVLCGNLLTRGWDPAVVRANFSPIVGDQGDYAFAPGYPNEIRFPLKNSAPMPVDGPATMSFQQVVTVPGPGQYLLSLDIRNVAGDVNQVSMWATFGGVVANAYGPQTGGSMSGLDGQYYAEGQVSGDGTITARFDNTGYYAGQLVLLVVYASFPNITYGPFLQSFDLANAVLKNVN